MIFDYHFVFRIVSYFLGGRCCSAISEVAPQTVGCSNQIGYSHFPNCLNRQRSSRMEGFKTDQQGKRSKLQGEREREERERRQTKFFPSDADASLIAKVRAALFVILTRTFDCRNFNICLLCELPRQFIKTKIVNDNFLITS